MIHITFLGLISILAPFNFAASGQVLALLLMAAALGTDAMTLAIGIGLRGVSWREGLKASLVIGLFHVIMPLIGSWAGGYLSRVAGEIARATGAGIVAVIGIRMIWGCLKTGDEGREFQIKLSGLPLLLLALSVSMDALSVGLGLGALGYNIYLTAMLFGVFGAGMTAAGLFMGNKMGTFLGKYGEAVGGGVLIIIAIKMFLEG